MSLLGIFASAILPIIAIAAVGFALGRVKGVQPDALNTVTVYLLAPALVLHSLATSALGGSTILEIVAVVAVFSVAMIVLAEGIGRASGRSEPLLGAFVMVVIFPNVGNFGIPLADFAFGQVGRSVAVLVTAVQGVLLYTLGVYVAARGDEGAVRENVKRVFTLPLVYAVVVALAARWLGVVPPTDSTVMQTLELLGNASIPVMLVVLGIQLSSVDVEGALRPVGLASGVKLLVAPVVALGAALLVGFGDATVARVVVLLLAGPTAVTPIILVGAFSGDTDGVTASEFVSATVFLTTVASVVTVTALVAILQSGVVI
ncbi:AEC family transporter [Halobacteria archaeon HArc-gm2]|nr:AEC family transporter [Halobacteria archaeon HArc-gm2]